MSTIFVVGSINMDIVSQVEKHPQPGETVLGKDFLYIPGGKGSNQAIAARRLGGEVSMLGKMGEDAFASAMLDFYKTEDLNIENISQTNKAPTGAAFVGVDSNSENIIYVSGGANDTLSTEDVEALEIGEADIVSATLETPIAATKRMFERAKEVGGYTVLNAAPAVLEAKVLLPLTDCLIVNEIELAAFADTNVSTEKKAVISALEKLKEVKCVIATLGKKGVVARVDGQVIEVEGHVVSAVDTTGAGDCFVGAFVTALQEKKTIQEAIAFANGAAAISVQRLGAAVSMPTKQELEKYFSN